MDEASIYTIIGEDGFRRLVASFYSQIAGCS
jgi:truncated hemoglobin YjbI